MKIIIHDKEENVYVASYSPGDRGGVVTSGKTKEEAIKNLNDILVVYYTVRMLVAFAKKGKEEFKRLSKEKENILSAPVAQLDRASDFGSDG